MSVQLLSSCKLWVGEFELSGSLNKMALKIDQDLVENTVFGMIGKSRLAGQVRPSMQHAGLWNPGTDLADEVLSAKLAVADVPVTICPMTGIEGDVAYSFQALLAKYAPGGEVGGMGTFDVEAEGSSDRIFRGLILNNTLRTTTGNGSPFQLGAVGATQKLWAALHVLSFVGTNIVIKIQSAPASNFAAPTDRITFSTVTTRGFQWATPVPGSITDTWWRVVWTLTGTSCLFVPSAGIL
jgi:hypothetical protein